LVGELVKAVKLTEYSLVDELGIIGDEKEEQSK